jgi:hypothetical protein
MVVGKILYIDRIVIFLALQTDLQFVIPQNFYEKMRCQNLQDVRILG